MCMRGHKYTFYMHVVTYICMHECIDICVTCKRFSGSRATTAKYLSTLAVPCGY